MIAYVPAIIVLSLAAGLLAADSWSPELGTRNLGRRERHLAEIDSIVLAGRLCWDAVRSRRAYRTECSARNCAPSGSWNWLR